MEAPKEDIIRKIKKLLSLSEGKANLNEALAAAEIAQRLILLHNIDEAELGASGEFQQIAEPVIDYVKVHGLGFTPIQNPSDYLQALMNVIAAHNGCAIYLTNAQLEDDGEVFSIFSIIGQKTQIGIVEYLFYWCMIQLEKLAAQESLDFLGKRDFYLGACRKLRDRFKKMEKTVELEVPKEKLDKALVVINATTKQIEDKMNEIKDTLNEAKVAKAKDNLAFARGFRAADKIALENQKELAGEETHKMLKE